MSTKKKSVPIWKSKVVIISAVFILIVLIFTLFKSFSSGDQISVANVVSASKAVSKVSNSSGTEGSDQYNSDVDQFNLKQFKEAEKKGGTFVSTISGGDRAESMADKAKFPIDIKPTVPVSSVDTGYQPYRPNSNASNQDLQLKQQNLELEKVRVQLELELKRAETLRQQNVKTTNKQALEREVKQIDLIFAQYVENEKLSIPESEYVVLAPVAKNQDGKEDISSVEEEITPSPVEEEEPPIRAGDVYYAINKIALNSDFSAKDAVIAEIISSDKKLNQTKFFGSFEYRKDSLIVKFNRYQLPDGTFYPVNAYAISEKDVTTAVKSSVDYHTFERWGLFFIGSIFESMARNTVARSQADTTVVYDYNGNPVGKSQTGYDYNASEELAIVLGDMASKAAKPLQENLNKPSTVLLDYGQTIGIIVLN